MSRRLAVAVLLVGLAAVLAACGGDEPYTFVSIEYAPPETSPALRLTDQHGQAFDLAALKGDVVAVFFGYTHCPDVCPFTLGELAAIRQSLPADQRDHFRVVMVTTDPERDTPAVLAEYMGRFDPTFIGLTGSRDQVLAARMAWGVRAELEHAAGAAADDYTVGHTSSVVLVNREGLKRLKMFAQMNNAERMADIAEVMRAG